MEIKHIKKGNTDVLYLTGKLDGFQSGLLEANVNEMIDAGSYRIILEMKGIQYLSSAGIRVLVMLLKKTRKLGGNIYLAEVSSYPLNVLKIAGFLKIFQNFDNLEEALQSFLELERSNVENDLKMEQFTVKSGTFNFRKISDEPSRLRVTGSNEDYLKSQCTLDGIVTEPLSRLQYTLGIGALGSDPEDCFNILGELMIINNSVVWLPTDGHKIPDFLITSDVRSDINVHTAFNLSLEGDFDIVVRFNSNDPEGIQIDQLYKELFNLSKDKFSKYKGMIGTVMRAEVGAVFGAGIKKAPILSNKPVNCELITQKDNIRDWLDFQLDDQHTNTTALIVGIGLDLNSDKVVPDYSSVFHINKESENAHYFHNHAAIFNFIPEKNNAEKDLKGEIDNVLKEGEFISMQRLMDKTHIKKAIIGLFYIDEII
jgi:anti-anti-sigma factor